MILFTSFNYITIFFLFVYLGLLSGLIFKSCTLFFNYLTIKTKKWLEKTTTIRNNPKTKQIVTEMLNYKNRPQKQRKKHIFKKFFEKAKQSIKKISNYILYVFYKSFPILSFIACVFFTYLINLYLNFGHLRLIYVLIWVLFFFVGKTLCKLLANYFLCFYNYFIKRIKKDGRAKQ